MDLRNEAEIISGWENDSEIMVSICTTTYNHQNFIKQTLDGFLMQKTTFRFEILIFDDASTDNNQQIILEYASKYPNLFRLFLQKENQLQKGIGGSLFYTFPNAKGKYIAMCEGDDYWTDCFKLQKQVDFLENNPDFVMCSHNSAILAHMGKILDDNQMPESVFSTKDILLNDWSIMTATIIFRRDALHPLQEWIYNVVNLDYALQLHFSTRGKIKLLPDSMSVYRRHLGGISIGFKPILAVKSMYYLLSNFNKETKKQYNTYIRHKFKNICKTNKQAAKDNKLRKQYIVISLVYYFSFLRINILPLISKLSFFR